MDGAVATLRRPLAHDPSAEIGAHRLRPRFGICGTQNLHVLG